MTDEKKNPLGSTGDQVRSNVARLREARGLTKKELSGQVAALGRPIPPLGISRIEAGTRRVDVDDLMALAVALRVSPMTLLLPWPDDPDDPVDVTAAGSGTARQAWDWAQGLQPPTLSEADPVGDMRRFLDDSLPPWARPLVYSVSVRTTETQWKKLEAAGYGDMGIGPVWDRMDSIARDRRRMRREAERMRQQNKAPGDRPDFYEEGDGRG